ncbi:methyltransferase domain-containing protein [Sphingomonas sp. DG1-23]|uniref:class I SAM-dependent methyltransferase n=1 Tax=Sphingomonas sp. DG1-23 TaxID=3068316 RepID=UPI00273D0B76|nr:class I SAM-dependent methyltransferase [Sphingomonas sp. DG1-23]MDP5278689.1 methyltransferase domain-containing protein [Sphingomonas sp. DG1-23]
MTGLPPAPNECTIRCPLCGSAPLPIMSLGTQPLAQDFLLPDQAPSSVQYELLPQICLDCGLAQLRYRPASATVFSEKYPYRSGVSKTMRDHLQCLAEYCLDLVADKPDPLLVEIGCNDGTLSRHFAERHLRHLGIDPARRAVAQAAASGVTVLNAEFNPETGRSVLAKYGKADLIVAANVIAHISDLRRTIEQICACLTADGSFVFEAISLFELMQRRAFDLFYDEHVYTFSATAVDRLARSYGLELVDCQPVSTQGGSLRYSLAKPGAKSPSPRVREAIRTEQAHGLLDPDAWNDFAAAATHSAQSLRQTLDRLRRAGSAVAGYGATAKSSVALTFAGLGRKQLDCIFDTTPEKVGLTSPCDRIPIRFPAPDLVDRYDYLVMFAWNFLPEIEVRERAFRTMGGKWITYHGSVCIA